jgi:fructose-1,6-bisphosphatase/inositol monophosphatase family enzyme
MSPDTLAELASVAGDAARQAGALISASRPKKVEQKPGAHTEASGVVTEVDRESQARILELLGPSTESLDLGLLTEESADDRSRLEKDFFWCIDPLDGTLPFVEGKSGHAVSIALVSQEGRPELGVIFDPVEGTLYSAMRGQGITRNGMAWRPQLSGSGSLTVFADRSFQTRSDYDALMARLENISEEMGGASVDLRIGFGAVMNACGALTHAPACYFKLPKAMGGGSLWDFAASACLFEEAGAAATDIHGQRLDLNRADSTFMNHRGVLFATSQDLARRIRALGGSPA